MPRNVHELRPTGDETVPVIVHTRGAGPTVAVTANIHGDEATGVAAVLALDEVLRDGLLTGTVVLYPSLNPSGLSARTRVFRTGHDLNRLFPGARRGGASDRHVHGIWTDLMDRGVELVVDLHADSGRSIPYAIVDRALPGVGQALEPVLLAHAHATGLTVLKEYPADVYVKYGLDRSLAGALVNRRGIPAITIEAGPRRWVDRRAVDATVRGVLAVLSRLDLVEVPDERNRPVEGGPWRRGSAPRTRASGLFHEVIPPGGRFEVGDVLGRVLDLKGETVDTLVASCRGVVISWIEASWLPSHSVPGTIGVEEDRA